MCDDNRPVVGMICRVGIVEEKSSYVVIMLVVACLNDKQLLNLVAGIALADAVPGGEGEGAAEGPHDRDCDFGGVCERSGLEKKPGRWLGEWRVTYWVARLAQPFPSCGRRCWKSWRS